jgi:hypothetical protein
MFGPVLSISAFVITSLMSFVQPFMTGSSESGQNIVGWQVGFPHSPAIAQTTVSSTKLYLSLHEVHCFCPLWNGTFV